MNTARLALVTILSLGLPGMADESVKTDPLNPGETSIAGPVKVTDIWVVTKTHFDLRGENPRSPVAIRNREFSLNLKPYAPASFILR